VSRAKLRYLAIAQDKISCAAEDVFARRCPHFFLDKTNTAGFSFYAGMNQFNHCSSSSFKKSFRLTFEPSSCCLVFDMTGEQYLNWFCESGSESASANHNLKLRRQRRRKIGSLFLIEHYAII